MAFIFSIQMLFYERMKYTELIVVFSFVMLGNPWLWLCTAHIQKPPLIAHGGVISVQNFLKGYPLEAKTAPKN